MFTSGCGETPDDCNLVHIKLLCCINAYFAEFKFKKI